MKLEKKRQRIWGRCLRKCLEQVIKIKGYCQSCKKEVKGVKKPFKWLDSLVWNMTIIGGPIYAFWRIFFVHKDRCPICSLLIKGDNCG